MPKLSYLVPATSVSHIEFSSPKTPSLLATLAHLEILILIPVNPGYFMFFLYTQKTLAKKLPIKSLS